MENEDLSEVISEILIQLHNLETRVGKMEEKTDRIERRMGFVAKRIVKAESRLETMDKILDELTYFKQEQLSLNKRFIEYIDNKML